MDERNGWKKKKGKNCLFEDKHTKRSIEHQKNICAKDIYRFM